MRRITIALMTTISGLVLLFSYHTSTNSPGATGLVADPQGPDLPSGDSTPSPATSPTGQDDGAQGGPSPSPADDASPSASPSAAGGEKLSGTFTGDPIMTEWGIVQVRIVVKDKFITGSRAIKLPDGNHHDLEINNFAVPILNQRVVDAQSAQFDSISGATVTSDGYKASLQSALDKAHW